MSKKSTHTEAGRPTSSERIKSSKTCVCCAFWLICFITENTCQKPRLD